MTIELEFFVMLRANFKLSKSEKLLIQFKRQIIIDIYSFIDVNVVGRKRPSNHFQSLEYFMPKFNFCVKVNS